MRHLNVELTDRCNLRCSMCGQVYHPETHLTPDHFMSFETWTAILESLRGSPEEISLCPHWLGEPTFHPEFDRFLAHAFAQNQGNALFRELRLHTNGVALGGQRLEVLLSCAQRPDQAPDTFKQVHFSLDALQRHTYRQVKGADRRDQAYSHALSLLEKRARARLSFPRITVAFIVTPENQHESRGFMRFWLEALSANPPADALPGEGPEVVYDWPGGSRDAIYFRRLNQADQAAADRLHRQVVEGLGLATGGWGLGAESF